MMLRLPDPLPVGSSRVLSTVFPRSNEGPRRWILEQNERAYERLKDVAVRDSTPIVRGSHIA